MLKAINPQSDPPTTNHSLQIDPNRLIRLRDVLQLIPVSRSCFLQWVKDGKAPAPVRLGGCTCWRYSDVVAMSTPKAA